ncbi:hypothetical protein JG687_00002647 [Phytophthora cactorum]|uniref:Uncharacterized protein n=1 Tax=Phytophthora cactorum TaxID=29920 RepID=A0A8T1UYG7_9STRA|nr:hypothetical protein JG687_00002647 [Phytophthora cactorum]
MLIFENDQVLLVSEREADQILELLWSTSDSCSFRLVNFALVCEGVDRIGRKTQFRDVPLALGCRLDQEVPVLSLAAWPQVDAFIPARALLPHGSGTASAEIWFAVVEC